MIKTSLTPHGPGFSFVDSCEVFENEKKARASKWLDPKSPFFADHFPERPLMPGVLLIEAAAQTAGILWQTIRKADPGAPLFLAQVRQFRFSKAVLPGETLRIDVVLEKDFGALAQFEAALSVDDATVAQGSFVLSRKADEPTADESRVLA